MDAKPERISVDQLTEAAFAGVLRALDERKVSPKQFPGPILVGIIAWPELSAKAGGVELPTQG